MSGRGRPRFGKLMMRLSMSYTPAMLCVTRSALARKLPLLISPASSPIGRYYTPAAAIARLTWSSTAVLILASNSLSESVERIVD